MGSNDNGGCVLEQEPHQEGLTLADRMQRIHATCVELDGKGILISGPSACGKSDLAVRLMDAGARLVADDYVELHPGHNGQKVLARCPPPLKGLLELRHIGVMQIRDSLEVTPIVLALSPIREEQPLTRMPDPACLRFCGIKVRSLTLSYFEASAVAKIKLLLKEGVELL